MFVYSFLALIAGDRDSLQKVTSKRLTLFEHMIYWWGLLCCLKASLVLKHIRMCCRATHAYDRDIHDWQVTVWTWKFSRTGCRESGFLPDGWPQCDSSDWLFLPLSHNLCIYTIDGHWQFCLQFWPSLKLFGCQALADLQKSSVLVPQFPKLCYDQ